jgi:hypothetical protein
MCFGGSSSGPTSSGTNYGFQNSTATTTPDVNAYNYLLAGLATANNITGIPYQPYTGQLTAGFSQDQLAAMQGVREAQGAAQPYIDQSAQMIAAGYNLSSPQNFSQAAVNQYTNPLMNEFIKNAPTTYSQQAVSQYYDPRLQSYLNYAPLSYSPEAVQQYYNPYKQNVIDTTLAQLNQQNAQQMQQQQAEAIRAGAFGGDRSSAARAQLAGQQSLQKNQVIAGLENQAYQNALAAFQQQQTQGLGIAGQQAAQGQNMFNAQQAAGLNARQQQYSQALAQYNQQQQQAIAAAQNAAYATSQLGSQEQQAALQGAQALFGSGQLQQQMQQQQINQSYNQWLANQAYPYQQLQAYLSAAGLTGGMGGTTTSNSSGVSFGNTQQSGTGSNLGSIIGSILSGIGTAGSLSDERTKTNVDYVGKDPKSGDNLYAYDYKSDVERSEETGEPMPPKRVSPMAQEVAEKNPDDVVDLGGLLGVKLGREGRANGGAFQPTNAPPIYLDTGAMSPDVGLTDLSNVAYKADPSLSSYKPSGLAALFSPQETYEKIKSKWVSKEPESDFGELKPFEAEDVSPDEDERPVRHKKAGGGSSENEDPSDFIAMSKYRPYGVTYNPKIATALSKPGPELNPTFPKTHELNYVPSLPGGKMDVKAPAQDDSMSKLGSKFGQLAKAGYNKLAQKDDSKGAAEPSFFDKMKTNVSEGLGGIFNASPVASDKAADLDVLGGLGKMFGGIFNEGGRVGMADGGTSPAPTISSPAPAPDYGNISGSQIGPVTNPFTSGTINGVPVGTGAFNTPVNTGVTVQEAFGPRGLGRDIPQSLANFRMPWSAVNTGSSAYNNLLLKASQNVGPRQLTPQEFGLPAINRDTTNLAQSAVRLAADIKNAPTQAQIDAATNPVERQKLQNQADLAGLKSKYPFLFATPTNYVYQPTNWLTPEGTYFMVPTSSYSTADYYVDPWQKTAPTFRASGGAVNERYPLSAQYLDEPEQDFGSLAQGIYPAVREVAFGNPQPGMQVMQEKTLGFGPVAMSHGGRTGYATLGGVDGTSDDFEKDVNQTIRFEGRGLVRDDAGAGPSKFGINKRANPDVDVENLDEGTARRLYKERYWDKIGASELPENIRPLAYDTSVLMGPGRAKEFLQASGGDPEKFMGMRRSFLNNLVEQNPAKYGKYAKSWENRNNELMGSGPVAMASAPAGVVAKDRGDEDAGVDTSLVSKASASDSGEGQGLFGMKPFLNPDLAMYLMATGAGMAASRSRNPLQAFGEGALQGVEALQASRAGRGADALHAMQVQNLQSEIANRNAQTEELLRKVAARKRLLGGAPSGGEPTSSDTPLAPPTTAAPTVEAPEAPKIVEGEATQPKSLMEKTAEAEKPSVEPAAPATPKAAPSVDPIDTEIARASSDEKKFSLMAQRLLAEGLDAEASKFEKLATDAQNNRKTLMQEKRKSLTEKVDESSPMGQYRSATSGDISEFKSTLDEAKSIIGNEAVKFGPMASTIAKGKTLGKELSEEFLPEQYQPNIDTSSASLVERLGAIGKQATLDKLGGKLGAGISNADVSFMLDTDFNPEKSRAFNEMVLAKKEAALAKKAAFKEEALRYKQTYGINANFADHMAEWGDKHPIKSFMRKEEERKVGDIGSKEKPVATDRKIVKRGTSNGRPVVQYEDGTIEYAD